MKTKTTIGYLFGNSKHLPECSKCKKQLKREDVVYIGPKLSDFFVHDCVTVEGV